MTRAARSMVGLLRANLAKGIVGEGYEGTEAGGCLVCLTEVMLWALCWCRSGTHQTERRIFQAGPVEELPRKWLEWKAIRGQARDVSEA